jgi:hypothetical protein
MWTRCGPRTAGAPTAGWPRRSDLLGWLVGLPGLEPGTSSLSAIGGLALCDPASSQVMRDRRGSSNALYVPARPAQGLGRRSCGQAREQIRRRQGDGLPGGRGSPIECVTVTVVRSRARPEPCGSRAWRPAGPASHHRQPPSETTSQVGCPFGSVGGTGAGAWVALPEFL